MPMAFYSRIGIYLYHQIKKGTPRGAGVEDMEKSLLNAIAKAKRNAIDEKYSFVETLLDVIYEYNLRDDEVEILYNSFVKYCDKWALFNNERYDIEVIKRNI